MKYAYLLRSTLALLCCLYAHLSVAQSSKLQIAFQDSLEAAPDKAVLYNVISITNGGNDHVAFTTSLRVPQGWKALASDLTQDTIRLAAGETKKFPLNLTRSKTAIPEWRSVVFSIYPENTLDTLSYKIQIKATPTYTYVLQSLTEEQNFTAFPDSMRMGYYLKNTGNAPNTFTTQWSNGPLDIKYARSFTLQPGKDTTIYYKPNIKKANWKSVEHETIQFQISNKQETKNLAFVVNSTKSNYKVHSSAYNVIPISITTGAIVTNNMLSYNYGASTNFSIGDHTFGGRYQNTRIANNVANNLQRGIWNINYGYKNWKLAFGQMSAPMTNFIALGNGASVGYYNKTTQFSIQAVKHSKNISVFANDNIAAFAKYKVGKVIVKHSLENNINNINNVRSYVIGNDISIFDSEKLKLSLSAGAGVDHFANYGLQRPGYSGGYNVGWSPGRFAIGSSANYFDNYHPGIRRGQRMQFHSINYNIKKSYVGVLYNSTFSQNNVFRDSVYQSDILSYNYIKYGFQAGNNSRFGNVYVSAGIYENKGTLRINNISKAYYADGMYTLMGKNNLNLNLGSQNTFTDDALITSANRVNFRTKYAGISGTFLHTLANPYNADHIDSNTYRQTVNANVSHFFYFLNNALTGSIMYQASKSLQEDVIRSGVGLNLNYNNYKSGTSVAFTGYLPVNQNKHIEGLSYTETKYGILSVVQNINVPIVTKRKYYDMKVVLFNDVNGNSMQDNNEELLDDVFINIGSQNLITNKHGEANYINVKSGFYNIGLNSAKTEGLVPVGGPEQKMELTQNTTVSIPFKKGKVISGRVKIIRDAFKDYTSEQYIKVIATDSTGRKYTTLTDEEGNFFIYVPGGIFDVALNKDAFTGGDLKPVKLSYKVDIDNYESSLVCFELKQKKREVRFLDQKTAVQIEEKPPVAKSEPQRNYTGPMIKREWPALKDQEVPQPHAQPTPVTEVKKEQPQALTTPQPKAEQPVTESKPEPRQDKKGHGHGRGHGSNSISMR